MRTIVRHIRHESRADEFHIIPLSDPHLGNEACDEKAFASTIKRIADDPFAYWIGMGDYCDFINRKDKRFDVSSLPKWLYGAKDIPKTQIERVVAMLVPIKDKCLAFLKGNHEDDMALREGRDVYATLIEKLAPDGKQAEIEMGYSGFLLLRFHRGTERGNAWTLPLFLTHGWWGGRLMGNGALNLERLFGYVDALMVLAGHDHKRRAFPLTRLRPRANGGVERETGYCCSCGTFLDGAKYAERKGYRDAPIGSLEITVRPDSHEIKVTQ